MMTRRILDALLIGLLLLAIGIPMVLMGQRAPQPVEASSAQSYAITSTDTSNYIMRHHCITRKSNGALYVFYSIDSGAQGYYAYSTNGGATWATPVSFTSGDPLVYFGNVSVDIDSAGTIHILYTGWDAFDNGYVRYRQLSNTGYLSSIEAVDVSGILPGVGLGGIYVDTSDNCHVAYYKYIGANEMPVIYKERIAGVWSAPTTLWDEAGPTHFIQALEIGPYNTAGTDVLVAFNDVNQSEALANVRESGAWGGVETVETLADSLFVDVYVARDQRIYYPDVFHQTLTMACRPSGGGWTTSIIDSGAEYDDVSQSTGSNGISSLYLGKASGDGVLVGYKSTAITLCDNYMAWTGGCDQDKNLTSSLYTIYQDFDGVSTYTLYFRTDGSTDGVACSSVPGTTVAAIVAQNTTSDYIVGKRDIAVDSNDKIYLFYITAAALPNEAWYEYSEDAGATWSAPINFTDGETDDIDDIIAVDINSSDTILILYQGSGGGTQWIHCRSLTNGVLGSIEVVASTSTSSLVSGDGFIDSTGIFHTVYVVQTGGIGTVYCIERSAGGVWGTAVLTPAVGGAYASIGPYETTGTNLLVAYEAGFDDVYAMTRISGTWAAPVLVSSTVAGTGTYVGRNGKIYASFAGRIEEIYRSGGAWVVNPLTSIGSACANIVRPLASSMGVPFWIDDGALYEYCTAVASPSSQADGLMGCCELGVNVPHAAMVVYNYFNGSTYYLMFLSQVPPPIPVVTTLAATAVGTTSATLHGTGTDNSGLTWSYRFRYGKATYDYSTVWTGAYTGTQAFEATIYGLDKGAVYYFVAEAKNAIGTATGSAMSFTLTADPPTISIQPASAISITTAQLNSYLDSDGGGTTSVRFGYTDTTDYWAQDNDDADEIYDVDWSAQSFDVSTGYDIVGVLLALYREGSPGDLAVELRDDNAGSPDNLIDSGTITAADVTTSTGGDWYLALFGPDTLDGATTYHIVLHCTGDSSNSYHWLLDTTGGYTNGQVNRSTNGGGSWTPDGGEDLLFGTCAEVAGTNAIFTAYVGGYASGTYPSVSLEGFNIACPYGFYADAYNSYGTASTAWDCFVTSEHLMKPTNLVAMGTSDTEIGLSWAKGEGSQKTKVVYKSGDYPVDYNDGTLAYFGTGSSVVVTALQPGTIYFFAAWSYAPPNDAGYAYWGVTEPAADSWDWLPNDDPSTWVGTGHTADAGTDANTIVDTDDELWSQDDDYYRDDAVYNITRSGQSDINSYVYTGGTGTLEIDGITSQTNGDEFFIIYRARAVGMTYAGGGPGGSPYQPPGGGGNWFLEPSDSVLANLPGRGIMTDAAAAIGIGTGNLMCMLALLIAAIAGFIAFMTTKKILVCIGVIAVVLLIGMIIGPVPGWIFFLFLFVGGSSGYLLSKGAAV